MLFHSTAPKNNKCHLKIHFIVRFKTLTPEQALEKKSFSRTRLSVVGHLSQPVGMKVLKVLIS